MFNSENGSVFEIIGIYKIERDKVSRESYERRYSTLSIRLRGTADFVSDNKTYGVSDHDILYVPHAARYSQKTDTETVIAIHFITYNSTDSDMRIYRFNSINEIRDLFIEIFEVWSAKGEGYKYLCTSIFYKIIYMLNNAHHDDIVQNRIETLLKPACDYIHQNFKQDKISVKKLADMVFMSEVWFRKKFFELYGVSPNKYIRLLRLAAATKTLQTSNMTIAEIAEKTGFGDDKYFIKQFRITYNMSPTEYRKRFK